MTRAFHHSRIRKNRSGITHKDPCAAFVAGVDLKESADATWARKNESTINGNGPYRVNSFNSFNSFPRLSRPWPTFY
jgi:hypothetical protein